MGVYIKGITIEMLKNAPLEAVENLLASGDMVEVKEPHGRLVDLDALEKERDSIDCYGNSLVALEWDDECILNAPTIIESEE